MGVTEAAGQGGHDDREGGLQLFGWTVCHNTQNPNIGYLNPPILFGFETVQKVGQEGFDCEGADFGDEGLDNFFGLLPDVFVWVRHIEYQDLDDGYDSELDDSTEVVNEGIQEMAPSCFFRLGFGYILAADYGL